MLELALFYTLNTEQNPDIVPGYLIATPIRSTVGCGDGAIRNDLVQNHSVVHFI